MTEQRRADAVSYLKEVLRETSEDMPRAVKEILGQVILHAYLRGREDEARLHEAS